MGLFEQLGEWIVTSHIETYIVDCERFQVNVLIVAQPAEFGRYASLNNKNTILREMRRHIFKATNLLILR